MLDICHVFGAAYDVRFNPGKYNLIHFPRLITAYMVHVLIIFTLIV